MELRQGSFYGQQKEVMTPADKSCPHFIRQALIKEIV
jgi:hypothetical protein